MARRGGRRRRRGDDDGRRPAGEEGVGREIERSCAVAVGGSGQGEQIALVQGEAL